VLIKGNIFSPQEAGIIGNVITSSGGRLAALAMGGGAVLGTIGTGALINKVGPMLHGHPVMKFMIASAISSGPLIGIMGGAMAITGLSSFKDLMQMWLGHLGTMGMIKPVDGPPQMPFQINVMAVAWGTVIHREKRVRITSGPGRLRNTVTVIDKPEKFLGFHFENWNRMSLEVPLPGLGKVTAFAKFDLDFDLTCFVERMINYDRFKENQKRVEFCSQCVQKGMAFCDWRVPLGKEGAGKDECVPDSPQEKDHCESDIGVFDAVGESMKANFYGKDDGLDACQEIDFPRWNREFRMTSIMRRYLRRH
jgi:hypothetical protein